MLPVVFLTVEEVPELRALILGVPLPKLVAVGEEALFGTCFLFVPAGTTEGCIEFAFLQLFEQDMGLQVVYPGIRSFPGSCARYLHATEGKGY